MEGTVPFKCLDTLFTSIQSSWDTGGWSALVAQMGEHIEEDTSILTFNWNTRVPSPFNFGENNITEKICASGPFPPASDWVKCASVVGMTSTALSSGHPRHLHRDSLGTEASGITVFVFFSCKT